MPREASEEACNLRGIKNRRPWRADRRQQGIKELTAIQGGRKKKKKKKKTLQKAKKTQTGTPPGKA